MVVSVSVRCRVGVQVEVGVRDGCSNSANIHSFRYEALVVATAQAYGNNTRFFLACGPMSSDYCTEVI